VLLDCRTFRSPLKLSGRSVVANAEAGCDAARDAQWAWLAEQFRRRRRCACSVRRSQSSRSSTPPRVANFPAERERLYKLLRETKGGRRRRAERRPALPELSQTDAGLGYPLYDLT